MTRLDANGNCCIRDPFPGNVIPQSRLAVGPGFQIANAFPKPNVGDGLLVNNYSTAANTSEDHFQNFLGRVDQTFSDGCDQAAGRKRDVFPGVAGDYQRKSRLSPKRLLHGRDRNPSAPNTDESLVKALKFSERNNGQIRVEAFNLTNTWIPSGPNTNVTNPAFGTIPTAQSNISRQVQLAFKLNF